MSREPTTSAAPPLGAREVDYVKYAEEAGAACEEMKHGIEEVIKEVDHVLMNCEMWQQERSVEEVQNIINKHLSKYLDE